MYDGKRILLHKVIPVISQFTSIRGAYIFKYSLTVHNGHKVHHVICNLPETFFTFLKCLLSQPSFNLGHCEMISVCKIMSYYKNSRNISRLILKGKQRKGCGNMFNLIDNHSPRHFCSSDTSLFNFFELLLKLPAAVKIILHRQPG